MSLRQPCRNNNSIWLISVKPFERIARLFSRELCTSRIATELLHESKHHLIKGLFILGTKVELSLSGLQQANGLAIISFKSQLKDPCIKRLLNRRLRVYC